MPQGAYLDFAASAPPRPEAARAAGAAASAWANPSSPHAPGRQARAVVERARAEVAARLGCAPPEIIFTSGATEANNLAVLGAAAAASPRRREIVVSAVEHHSVLEPCRALRARGFAVREVPPDPAGCVPAAAVAAALGPGTALCALMFANNEVGTLQPVAEVAAACGARDVPLLVDAVAAAGREDLGAAAGAAFVTLSAHKLGGPKGAGALRVAPEAEILPPWSGGAQERGWRPGTEDVAAIAGFGAAARAARLGLGAEARRLRELEARLRAGLGSVPGLRPVGPGDPGERVPGLLSCACCGLDGQALLVALDLLGVAVGSGAACTSGSLLPSHVLLAMGLPAAECRFPLRFSLGWCSTEADVDAALRALREAAGLQARRR